MLPKTSAHVKSYDCQTKWISFLIEDDDLLKTCNTIWDKVTADIKKIFDNEPVYNKKCSKTKRKSYDNKATDFLDKEMSKAGSDYTCLGEITLESAL